MFAELDVRCDVDALALGQVGLDVLAVAVTDGCRVHLEEACLDALDIKAEPAIDGTLSHAFPSYEYSTYSTALDPVLYMYCTHHYRYCM